MPSTLDLPVVDLDLFLADPTSDAALAEAKKAVEAFQKFGACAVKDSRVTFDDMTVFLDQMEKYYAQPTEAKLKDARPDLHYQVGVTPEFTETPRDWTDAIANLPAENAATAPTGADCKWRFHHRLVDPPKESKFPLLNAPPVVPEAFKDTWLSVMDRWGHKMLSGIEGLAQMLATGFSLDKDYFTAKMQHAPHILAPTGCDLEKFGKLGQVIAGYHTDLNFITVHGNSRFPGLYVWTRDGQKVKVIVPKGCLLAQAGQQLEYLTGGNIMAGFHEVIVTEETLKALEEAKAAGRIPWRVSSTTFTHIASDASLAPEGPAFTPSDKYPPCLAGEQVKAELDIIKLHK